MFLRHDGIGAKNVLPSPLSDIAKIYRKNACQEVFGASQILVPMIFVLPNFKTLIFNVLKFIGTKFCPYDFWEIMLKTHHLVHPVGMFYR